MKQNTWYKVFYRWTSEFDGLEHTTFEFAMNEQVQRLEDRFKAEGTYLRTEEWIIK